MAVSEPDDKELPRMRLSGTSITTFDAQVKPDFRPLTAIALRWRQLSNGNHVATDRSAVADTYEAQARLYGTEATINNFITQVEANRAADDHVVSLSDFSGALSGVPTDSIFGANVDHSGSISTTIVDNGRKAQRTWKGFSLGVRFRALSPTFVSDTGALPLTNLEVGFEGDSDVTVNKINSYSNAFTYQDRQADIGLFKGTFVLTTANMKIFRNLLRTTRGSTFSISAIGGVSSMFGPRRGSFPHNVKVVDWEDLGKRDADRWRMRVAFAEHI